MSTDLFQRLCTQADAVAPDGATPDQLWSAADIIDASSTLGRALTERTAASTDTQGLVDQLFAAKVAPATLAMLQQTAALEWEGPQDLIEALHTMAVRVTWRQAEAEGAIDRVRAELAELASIVGTDSELDLAFGSIVYPVDVREKLLDTLVGATMHPLTMRLAHYAIESEAAGGLDRALDRWLDEAADLRGHLRARTTFAIEPTPVQLARLAGELERIYGRPVDIEVRIDPAVLGGVRVEIGDDIIDGSAAAQLERARAALAR
ncbi:MAG: F0F1 ATP synthase subunit delta [Propionibacteriaceae bacterium]|nr:F0F1 ATP synthase subunit delta [Propionibacteriaceae bacterium]